MIKAVLFDMDGVLVDTEWFYNRRRVAFMEEKGFHFDEIPDLSGSNEPAIWKALVPDDVELRERLRVEYKQVYSPDHPVPYAELLNEQTEPVMRELHERGVKCAIASSSYRELIDELVDIAGIADVLDYTISGHECSAFKPGILLPWSGWLPAAPFRTCRRPRRRIPGFDAWSACRTWKISGPRIPLSCAPWRRRSADPPRPH